jgi:hypothetical protein
VIESVMRSVPCDEQGRFVIDDVPAGQVQLAHVSPSEADAENPYWHAHIHPVVKAGESTQVIVGGRGRIVTGKLTGLDNYDDVTVRIAPNTPRPGDPDRMAAWSAFARTELGKLYFREPAQVNVDGTFRIEAVLSENYQLFVQSADKSVHHVHQLRVPAESADAVPEPQSVGEIAVTRRAAANDDSNQKAPQARSRTLDIIVAEHVLLWDGEIVTWGQVLKQLRKLRKERGGPIHPNFYFTNGAHQAGAWDLYKPAVMEVYPELFQPVGVSFGSISPRAGPRYDAVRTPADLVSKPQLIRRGTVRAADGRPASGVTVMLMPEDALMPVMLNPNMTLRDRLDEVWAITDDNGQFQIEAPNAGCRLAFLSPRGFALAPVPSTPQSIEVSLAPLARVELSGVRGKKQTIHLSIHLATMPDSSPGFAIYELSLEETLNVSLPPGKATVSRSFEQGDGSSRSVPAETFTLEAGQVKALAIGLP